MRTLRKMEAKVPTDMSFVPSSEMVEAGATSEKVAANSVVKPKKKSTSSFYVKFFEIAQDGRSRRCKLCNQNYSISTATGNLRRHLNSRHSGYGTQMDTITEPPPALPPPKKPQVSSKAPSLDFDQLNFFLLKWFIERSFSASTFEDDGLLDAFKFVNPSVKLWERCNTQSMVGSIFRAMRNDVRLMVERVNSKIALTLEFWTSYENFQYMGITGHWINENWVVHKVLLDVLRIPCPHTGLEIYQSLVSLFGTFNISNRILSCTHDGSQNAVLACNMLMESLEESKLSFAHISCAAQSLKLIIEDGLLCVKAAIAKIRECVMEINTSPEIAQDFNELASACQEGSWKFPLDVSDRWCGQYMMLEIATKAHTAMDALIIKHEKCLAKNRMSAAEKMAVDRMYRYLEPFYKTTNNLCRSKFPTIGLVLFFMDNIVEMINTCRDSHYEQEWLKNAAVEMGNKALQYNSQVYNHYTYMSAVLDPRIKGELVPMELNSEANLEAARNHFVMYYSSGHFAGMANGYTSQEVEDASSSAVSFAEEIARKRRRANLSSPSDELTHYLSEPPAPISTDVLEWWRMNSTRYPRLCIMARDFLAVQATSVLPVYLFSAAGDIADKQRMCLAHDEAQPMLCIQSWMRSGFKLKHESGVVE